MECVAVDEEGDNVDPAAPPHMCPSRPDFVSQEYKQVLIAKYAKYEYKIRFRSFTGWQIYLALRSSSDEAS